MAWSTPADVLQPCPWPVPFHAISPDMCLLACAWLCLFCVCCTCVYQHTHTQDVYTFSSFFPPLSFTHSNRNSSMLHQLVNNAILVNKSRERGLMETYPETENDKNKIKFKKDPEETNLLLLWGWYASQLKEQRTWAQLFLINSALFSSILIIPEQHIITTTLREPENKSRIVLNIYNKVDISVNMLKCLYLSLYKVSKPQRPNHQNKSYKKGKWTGTYK